MLNLVFKGEDFCRLLSYATYRKKFFGVRIY
jgi:hypothetical protein